MKKIILLMVWIMAFSTIVNAQNLDRFFNRYANDNNFQYSVIDNSQPDFAKNKGVKGIAELLQKISGVKTLTLKLTANNASLANEFARDIYYTFNTKKFEIIASNEGKDNNSQILRRKLKNGQTDIIVINKENEAIDLIWLKGAVNEN